MTLKAFEVVLSDGRTIVVREPRTDELPYFLRALPSLISLSQALDGVDLSSGIFIPLNLSDAAMEPLYPLMAKMAEMSEDELRALPVWDGFALMNTIKEFIPANFMELTPTRLS